LGASALVELSR